MFGDKISIYFEISNIVMIRTLLNRFRKARQRARLVGWKGAMLLDRIAGSTSQFLELRLHFKDSCHISTNPLPVFIRANSTDLDVFESTFLRKDYQLPESTQTQLLKNYFAEIIRNGDSPLILDCGANTGFSSVYFKIIFPEAIVISIEPEPANYEMLQRNTFLIPNCLAVNAAVGSATERGIIEDSGNGDWAFRIKPTTENDSRTNLVDIYTIEDVIAKASAHFCGKRLVPFICKADIEGGEEDVFTNCSSWFTRFPLFAIELHDAHFPDRSSSTPFLKAVVKEHYQIIFNHEIIFAYRRTSEGRGSGTVHEN
jgi:FkbM family methyltransferase